MAMDPQRELEELLGESEASVIARERALAEEFSAPGAPPLVLFGAGHLGRKAAAGLRRAGITCAAFSDNSERLWGKEVEDLPVLPPAEAAARYGERALFVVTIWRGEGWHLFSETRDQLHGLGCRRVTSFIPLFWGVAGQLLPHITIDVPRRVIAARSDVARALHLWSDEASRGEYVAETRWRLSGDPAVLPLPASGEQYIASDLFSLTPDDVFVDCGAFDGDTIKDLVARPGPPFRAVHAFEPDPGSMAALQSYVSTLPSEIAKKITLHSLAVSSARGTVRFDAVGTPASAISAEGEVVVPCAPLDDVLAQAGVTLIKMDIEGAEADALRGAARLIRERRPILAVAVYHRQADLWELPLLIDSLTQEYHFFLRPHRPEGFDLVCYAVPQER